MSGHEKKFYVVWKWKKTWIFDSWEQCKQNVNWFSEAKYKCFKSLEEATKALSKTREDYYEANSSKPKSNNLQKLSNYEKYQLMKNIPFFAESIAVDAACSENPWKMEYRWIDLQTWEEIFHEQFSIWTNNIWEFLAIVHWLKYLWSDNHTIYSDSKIAISRVKQWKCKTKLKSNNNTNLLQLLNTIQDAEKWLKNNWINHNILKRNTKDWWEIPADFWRK